MIPNTDPNIRAFYGPADDERTVPVVAWDEEGAALIPTTNGQLRRARDLANFKFLFTGTTYLNRDELGRKRRTR